MMILPARRVTRDEAKFLASRRRRVTKVSPGKCILDYDVLLGWSYRSHEKRRRYALVACGGNVSRSHRRLFFSILFRRYYRALRSTVISVHRFIYGQTDCTTLAHAEGGRGKRREEREREGGEG